MRLIDFRCLTLICLLSCPSVCLLLLFGCHPSCSTCVGPNSNQCLTCTSALLPVSGSCLCPDGSYPTSGFISCGSCNSACGTCTGPASTSCTGCKTGTFLYNNICYTDCNSNQYFDITALSCGSCHAACLTCTGPSAQECASCFSGTLTNGECKCGSGEYKDSNFMCQTCDSTCKECSGPFYSQCTACQTGMILQSNQCKCSTGKYLSTNPVSCLSCNAMCKGCTGPASNQCTSCNNNMVLGSDGQCKCPSNMYLDTGSTTCLGCDASCQECTGSLSTQCSACKNNMLLVSGQCGCGAGTYLDSANMICLACHSSCKTCSGPASNQCSSCDSSFALITGQCKCTSGCTCPDGTYFDSSSYTCLPCSSACKTCNGPASTQCLSCDSGQTLVGTVCKCSGVGCTCPDGTYLNPTTFDCDPCDGGCLTCDGPTSTDCKSCKNNLVLSSKQCTCNPGTFLKTSVNTCLQCSSTCKTCTGETYTQCSSCKNNMQLLATNKCGCGTGTFADLGTFSCVNCDGSCTECTGPESSQCTQCASNKVLLNNYCLEICGTDEFRASDGSCQKCTSPCATCSGAGTNQCKSCFSDDDLISGECISKCHLTCSQCAGPASTQCTACKNSLSFLTSDGTLGKCLEQCPDEYYSTTQNSQKVCLQKSAINNRLAYGSEVTQVKVLFGKDISKYFEPIVTGIQISIAFVDQQPPLDYTYGVQLSADSTEIIISFKFSAHFLPGNLLTINYDDFKDDNSTDFYLANNQHQLRMLEYFQYSASTQAAINATSAASTAANQANGVFSVGSSLVVNSIHSMRSEIVQDMLAYFIYMNIEFPPNFIQFMSGDDGPFAMLFPNLGDSIVKTFEDDDDEDNDTEEEENKSGNALQRYTPNHSFLSNNGFILFAFVLFMSILILVEIVRFFLLRVKQTKYPKLINFLVKGIDSASYAMRWNFLVNQYIGVYIDLIFFGLLQIAHPPVFKGFIDYLQYAFGFVGFALAFLGLVFMYLMTSRIFNILKKNKDVKEEDRSPKETSILKRLGILFVTFCHDKRSRLNYPFLLLARSFGFSMVLIFLQDFPLIQVLFVLITTLLVVAYLVHYRPLSTKSQNILTIVYEGLFLIACIMATALHIYNQDNLSNITVRSNMGFVLCSCSLAMVVLNFSSMIMELLKLREFFRQRKETLKVKPLSEQLSKTNSEMPFKLVRNVSMIESADVTKRGIESSKDISFSQAPTLREDRKLAPQENFEEENWLKDNVTPKETTPKEMSPDLLIAKTLMEFRGGQNDLMVEPLPITQLRKRQFFTKRSVQIDPNYEATKNIKLIKHIQELNVGRLKDWNSNDNGLFDYSGYHSSAGRLRESSERNLMRDKKNDLYKQTILRSRPQTSKDKDKEKEKDKEREKDPESDNIFDFEGTDTKDNYTHNTNDDISFADSAGWIDSKSAEKKSESFFKWRDSDEDGQKRSNFRFDKWKEANDKLGLNETQQISPLDSNIFESKDEDGKSEKEKSKFFIEISDVNIPSTSGISSGRSPMRLLPKRNSAEKEFASPMFGAVDSNAE